MTTTLTPRTTARRRAVLPAAACAVALALGACGGGGGGDEQAYVDTWNETCASLTKTRTDVRKETEAFQKSGSAKSTDAQAKLVAGLYVRIIGSLRSGYGELRDAEAPSKWSDFQDDLRTSLTKNDAVLAKAENALKPQNEAAVKAGVAALGEVAKIPTPPKDLTKKLTGCQAAGIAGVSSS